MAIMPSLFNPFEGHLVCFLEAESFKKHKKCSFFRFFVKQPSKEKNCCKSKYFDLEDTMLFFQMYRSHVMIRGIKKMSVYCGLDFVTLWKLVTKIFVTKKGQKGPFLTRLANKRWKIWPLLVMQPMQNLYFSESTYPNE